MKCGHCNKEHEYVYITPKCCSSKKHNAPMQAVMHESGLLSLICYGCGKSVAQIQTAEGTLERLFPDVTLAH